MASCIGNVKQYTVLLSRYVRSHGGGKIFYTDREQYEEEHNHVYYSSKVTVEGQETKVWGTPVSYASLDLAQDAAAMIAYRALTGTNPSSPPAKPPAPQLNPEQERSTGEPPASRPAVLSFR